MWADHHYAEKHNLVDQEWMIMPFSKWPNRDRHLKEYLYFSSSKVNKAPKLPVIFKPSPKAQIHNIIGQKHTTLTFDPTSGEPEKHPLPLSFGQVSIQAKLRLSSCPMLFVRIRGCRRWM